MSAPTSEATSPSATAAVATRTEPVATAAARPDARAGGRDPWFDNAKMALVTLVVVGHSMVMLLPTELPSHFYDFLYAWHMPAFVLVTGYLSRSFAYSPYKLWVLVRSVAVPYVLIEGALALFRVTVGGESLDQIWVISHWPTWFLPALFCWRLATPVARRLGRWAIPVAVVISLAAGYVTMDYLSLRRILGFLPFFVIGLCLTPTTLERIRSVPAKLVGVLALVGIWLLTAQTDAWAQTRWFYYSWSYENLTQSDHPVLVIRAAVLVVGLIGALAALSLVPRRRTWFTAMGAASLVVYLCHGFFIKTVEYTSYPDWAMHHPETAVALNAVGAVGLALLLASPWVACRLERAIDPLGYADKQVDKAVALHARADRIGDTNEETPAPTR